MRTPTGISARPADPYDDASSPTAQEYAEPAEPPLLPEFSPELPPQLSPELPSGDDETASWPTPDDHGHRHRRRGRSRHRRRPAKTPGPRVTRRRTTRRSRRRPPSPLRTYRRATKFLLALLFGTAFLVLADRCAVMYAEKKAQQKLQQALHLEAEPQVDIHGFPFLTQVLTKRLRQVDVTVPDVAADRVSLAKVRASAEDIRLTGSLPADIRGAVVGRLDGSVLLAFDDMNRELGASQVKFSDLGGNAIGAKGRLSVAGQELVLRAQARLRRDGDRAISTEIGDMSLDIPRVATYRPGPSASGSDKGEGDGRSLTLHPEAAERISRDVARVKALLSVPAIAERLGVTEDEVALALRSEERLHEITGAPRFVEKLTRINLVDLVLDNPWLLRKLGIDPQLITALTHLQPPALADRLALSFRLPKQAEDLHLRKVTVQRDGIRVELTATGLPVGKKL
ncbi:DUF2993 domain-containing protein [Streptomyces sp. NPDC053048]|uniref:DUF2993 domain-containing protein n=1 Tax=Streptomyces sp. NPDC053048 TaxID=3365694 RepID=UPI0037CD7548